MTRADELPAPIQWHEGMLLAPQHFQQLCQRSERLLHYHLAQLSPHHYGVVRLRIDTARLYEGNLRVLELEAILPDGLVVSHVPSEDGDLQVDVKPFLDLAKQGAVPVYLAIPGERPPGTKADGDLGRYRSVIGQPVVDEGTGERPIPIPRQRPRIRLLSGPEAPPARFTAMPIMAVRYKNGAFVTADYIPPMVQVPTDFPLGELCAQVSRRVREKGKYLVEIIRSPAITTKAEVVEENKRLLSYLMANLPPFEALLATGMAHPFALYTALCGLSGTITAIGSQLIPPVFSAYDHNDIRRSFNEVCEFLYRTMDEGISEAFTSIPFKFDAGVFGLNFEREWSTRVLIVGVKAPPGMSDQALTDWMASSLIGTTSRFKVLRERRLLGAPRVPIDRYEGLVATRGTLLYTLKAEPEFIVPNETLLIGNAVDKQGVPRPAEMFLYVANKG